MSTALAIPEVRTPAILTPWTAWGEKMAFAKELVGTGFCPSAIKTPAQALAVILTGQELGIPPMHALRSIHIIQGKPTLSAELMLALMLKGGVRLTWGPSDATQAVLMAERGTTAFKGSFTMAEAEAAKLTNKDGWRNYPAAMLRARVIALTARVVAPDLIAGMYTAEELGADVDAEGTVVAPPKVMPLEPEPTPLDGALEIDPESGRPEIPVREKVPVAEWVKAFEVVTGLKAGRALWTSLNNPDTWGQYTTDEQTVLFDAKETMKARLGANG